MRRLVKKYLIPHEGNNHRPHLLRTEMFLAVLIAVLVIEVFTLVVPMTLSKYANYFAEVLSNVLIDETNQSRLSNNLLSLTVNPTLEQAAKMKAQDMATKGYFAHTSPEGATPWVWFDKAGYKFAYAGENLAVNFFDSKDVANAWMNSPTHRANVLNDKFTEIGIATSQGVYEGHEAVFVVQLFGRPDVRRAVETSPSVSEVIPILEKPVIVESSGGDLFVAVKGAETAPIIDSAPAPKPQSNIVEKALVSPRADSRILYAIILTAILIAVALKLVIKMQPAHADLIMNGVLMLVIISGAISFNHYLTAFSSATVL